MADYTEAYKQLLLRAANVFEQLIQLYASDLQDNKEWAIATVAEAQTKRNGYLERLAYPMISAAYTATFVSSIMRFLEEHWLAPTRWTHTNPAKKTQLDNIQAELRAIMAAAGPLHNALLKS
jgi:hypothetical protein